MVHHHPKIEIELENELTIFEPMVYENVKLLDDTVEYSHANMSIHQVNEIINIGKKLRIPPTLNS